jgi:hypothetical protein
MLLHGCLPAVSPLTVGRGSHEGFPGIREEPWGIGLKKSAWEPSSIGPLHDSASRQALYYEGKRWSFADLKTETDRVAKGLLALGIQPDEKVSLWMPNRPEWISTLVCGDEDWGYPGAHQYPFPHR